MVSVTKPEITAQVQLKSAGKWGKSGGSGERKSGGRG